MIKRASWLLVGGALLFSVLNSESIVDWWRLSTYQPAQEIASLAEQASLTPEGIKYFYLGRPSISERPIFAVNCPVEERSIILGCYYKRNIYILRVERSELVGIMSVTAAHEMLHAAYEELKGSEKKRVDSLLEEFYSKSNDDSLAKLIAEYEKAEPGSKLNELHSILPTRTASLGSELEAYYERYFTNRQQVVNSYSQYESVFNTLNTKITSLKKEIDDLRKDLSIAESSIAPLKQEIERTNNLMQNYLDTNRISEYNALVPKQNQLVKRYNDLVGEYRQLVAVHNAKVEEVNALVLKQNDLVDSLDSTQFTPI